MIATTLNRIREHSPCKSGWTKLLAGLGKTSADDEPLAYTRILEICGLDDALWCLRAEPQHSALWRKMAVAFARDVKHLMTDPSSLAALDVAERYADGLATDADLGAASNAAWAAWSAADDTRAARADRAAAEAAVWASWAAAWASARAAARAARAARAAARYRQKKIFLEIVK